MNMNPFHSQGETKARARATVFIPLFYAGAVLLATSFCHGASLKAVTRSGGDAAYDSAVNQNFDRVKNELSNTVHKTGTETIRGEKTFVDSIVFQDSGSFGGNLDMNSHKITELTNGSASSDAAAFGQIPVVASQANQETGTSNTIFVSPGVQQYHPSAAKAWAVWTGTGTVTLQSAFNVTSITDEGAGDYTVNFTTPFSSTFYACTGFMQEAGTQGHLQPLDAGGGRTASSIRVNPIDTASHARIDCDRCEIICFGDQ